MHCFCLNLPIPQFRGLNSFSRDQIAGLSGPRGHVRGRGGVNLTAEFTGETLVSYDAIELIKLAVISQIRSRNIVKRMRYRKNQGNIWCHHWLFSRIPWKGLACFFVHTTHSVRLEPRQFVHTTAVRSKCQRMYEAGKTARAFVYLGRHLWRTAKTTKIQCLSCIYVLCPP
jgi:hypothetical protein